MERIALFLCILFSISGCTEIEDTNVEISPHVRGLYRDRTEKEMTDLFKYNKEGSAFLDTLKEGQRYKFNPRYAKSASIVIGNIEELNNLQFEIKDVTANYPSNLIEDLSQSVKNSNGKEILNSLIYDNCNWYITIGSTIDKSNTKGGFTASPYGIDYWLVGKIEIEFNGKTKTVKEIMLENGIIGPGANKVFKENSEVQFP